MKRAHFTAAVVAAVLVSLAIGSGAAFAADQEYYELRAYRVADAGKQAMLMRYLEKGLVPALERAGLGRIGVFTLLDDPEADEDDLSVWMIIPYPSAQAFIDIKGTLAADKKHLAASEEYYAQPRDDPMYSRVENWFTKAFVAMPRMVLPKEAKSKSARIYEVRFYESHNADTARRKIHMFNNGEIPIMEDVGLAPVLYGETLTGDNLPNLVYIVSGPNMEKHREHWQAFGAHPDWKRMSSMEMYKGTVSGILNFFLVPTGFSQM